MQNAPQRMNKSATRISTRAESVQSCSLDVLARALARKRAGHPKPHLITMLIGQCRRYGAYPDMGPKILETIAALEHAEHRG